MDGTDGKVPSGTTYTWEVTAPLNNNVSGQSLNTVPNNSISQTLSNATNVQQTVKYKVTPKYKGKRKLNGRGTCKYRGKATGKCTGKGNGYENGKYKSKGKGKLRLP